MKFYKNYPDPRGTEVVENVDSGNISEYGGGGGAPVYVEYTISGEPVYYVYPLTPSETLTDILARIGKCDIKAKISFYENEINIFPLTVYSDTSGNELVVFSGVEYIGNELAMVEIVQDVTGAQCSVVPISTAIMSYDSGTGTLAITN